MNNSSNLWTNCGWSPAELVRLSPPGPIKSISVGPNMKKMFASGEMNREEFEKLLNEMGVVLDD